MSVDKRTGVAYFAERRNVGGVDGTYYWEYFRLTVIEYKMYCGGDIGGSAKCVLFGGGRRCGEGDR